MSAELSMIKRGWWNMACWNGLSTAQQHRVRTIGNLEIGYRPAGWCQRGAQVEVTTMYDDYPGPRFYCCQCGAEYLARMALAMSR